MKAITEFAGRLLRGLVQGVLVLATAVLALSFLLATLLVVLAVAVGALLTGRKPALGGVFSRLRQRSQRYTPGVWPGKGRPNRAEVVDVEVIEVPDEPRAKG